MTDKLIDFETAKLAKEKGFYWHTAGGMFYGGDRGELYAHHEPYTNSDGEPMEWKYRDYFYYAPTQSTLQRWLREEKNIIVLVVLSDKDSEKFLFSWRICFNTMAQALEAFGMGDQQELEELEANLRYGVEITHEKYENALEEGLLSALNMIKQK